MDEHYPYKFYEFGWNSDYGQNASKYDFDNAEPNTGNDYLLDEAIEDIKKIVDICKQNNIRITIFTNPIYYITYEATLGQNYLEFLHKLSQLTEFCNSSGINDISVDSSNWIDNSYHNAEVSGMVLERMCFAFTMKDYMSNDLANRWILII